MVPKEQRLSKLEILLTSLYTVFIFYFTFKRFYFTFNQKISFSKTYFWRRDTNTKPIYRVETKNSNSIHRRCYGDR